MQRIISRITSLLAVVLIAGFSLIVHTVAMPMTGHASHGAKHAVRIPVNCATLCATSAYTIDTSDLTVSEEDDEFPIQFYAAPQPTRVYDDDYSAKLYAATVQPPPKVPIYVRYGIFRV